MPQTTVQQKDPLTTTAVFSTNLTSEFPTLTDTITTQTDITRLTFVDTMTSPFSLNEDIDTNQYVSTSGDEIGNATPDPDNKVPESNGTSNEPSTSQSQQNTTQTQTDEDNSDMSDYMKCPRFHEKLKSVKTKLTEILLRKSQMQLLRILNK